MALSATCEERASAGSCLDLWIADRRNAGSGWLIWDGGPPQDGLLELAAAFPWPGGAW